MPARRDIRQQQRMVDDDQVRALRPLARPWQEAHRLAAGSASRPARFLRGDALPHHLVGLREVQFGTIAGFRVRQPHSEPRQQLRLVRRVRPRVAKRCPSSQADVVSPALDLRDA
jgi:hypothetical protein